MKEKDERTIAWLKRRKDKTTGRKKSKAWRKCIPFNCKK